MQRTTYDAIYLSPHLDDAALSCGGQIFSQTVAGKSVLIVTIMAGDPPEDRVSEFAQSLHQRWQLLSDVVAQRRAEDAAACRVLGADYSHWPVPDCIYRLHPETGEPLYGADSDIFGRVHAAEQDLVDELARRFAALPPHGQIVCPLAAGQHVDHQIVRAAAERCFDRALLYYEDYPYVREPDALEAVISPDQSEWLEERVPLGDDDLAARIAAIAAFTSQVGSFFEDRGDLARQVTWYVRRVGGERLWRRRPSRP
ncbi:MAG: PIG-L deacetylase family protein [Anaerolineae bacterium]